ncbi:MAG TPA: tetratricopeptide repeat protein [Pyrinomonadaceae bacterium]|nr:tetratricopeptide repeat protein [Pyrinomonadaceae bacterium]
MIYRAIVLLVIDLACVACVRAQVAASSPTVVRSHVERFSTAKERAAQAENIANSRLANNQNDAAAFNLRGVARLRLGRYAESFEDLQRAVTLKPDSAEYQTNLGYVLWKLGKVEPALVATKTAIKLDDNNFAAHFQLGRFLVRLGGKDQLIEAIASLRRALELDPRQYDVRFELITAYRALGNTADATTQLDFLWDSLPSDARVFYAGALLATDRNDFNGAVKDFNEAVRRDPSLLDAWRDLGLAFVKLQRWPDAVDAFAEFAHRQPDSIEAAYLHALALYNTSKPIEAEREARRAVRLNSGAAGVQTLLGIILASRGNANVEAADLLSQAVALDPKSFDANFYLGRVQYVMRDFAGAVKSLRAATQLQPHHGEAHFFLGTALEAAGDSDAAMKEYGELIESDRDSVLGKLGLGALLLKQGKIEEAITALNSAISRDPKNFEAQWALGRALMLAQKFDQAVAALEIAVSISPNRSDAHYQLGLALRRLGRTQEANREFAIVDRLNTEFRTNAVPK